MTISITKRYRCDFCGKTFQREAWYAKHECEKRKRFNQSHNMDVIFGHKLFNHWSKRQGFVHRSKERSFDDFIKSPFYKTFIKLVEFSKENYVISSFKYLDWLIDKNVEERDWFKPKSLDSYRTWTRRNDEPEPQVNTTFLNVKKWCVENHIPLPEFFRRITPGDAINWLKLNKLSPWVLFGYDKAVTDLLSRFDEEKLLVLDEYTNTKYWLEKVKEHQDQFDFEHEKSVQRNCQRLFDGC